MQRFSPSIRVTEAEAKQDSIFLDMGDWFIQGIGNEIGAFFDLLGPRPTTANETAWANILTVSPAHPSQIGKDFFGWIFNRPAGNLDEHTELELTGGKGGRNTKAGSPLVKGLLRITKKEVFKPLSSFNEAQRRQIRLHLFLNPTRYLSHQSIPSNVFESPDQWKLGEPQLQARPKEKRKKIKSESRNVEVETSLDGNDNVLLGKRALAFGKPKAWPIHLQRYLGAVENTIHREFIRSKNAVRINGSHAFDRSPFYALKKVETYFEFSHENPIRLVRLLQPLLGAVGLSNKSRDFKHGLSQVGFDSNSTRIEAKLRGGCTLRVYAKSTHRVRFEISHDLKKPSASKLLLAEGGGYTTESRKELLDWFPRLARDATRRVNEILELIERDSSQAVNDSASSYELLGEIFGSIPNERRAKDFLKILVENGCIRVGTRGTDFLPEIRCLKRKGVLENTGETTRVTPRYRLALDKLREQDGLSPLSPSLRGRSRKN